MWSGIEVVITALTRNQVTGNRPWVRIPPAPPPNNPNLDTRLGLLLFVWKAAKHGASGNLPVGPKRLISSFDKAFLPILLTIGLREAGFP